MAKKLFIGPRDVNKIPERFRGIPQVKHHVREFVNRITEGDRTPENAVRYIVYGLKAIRHRIELMFRSTSATKKVLKARHLANKLLQATLQKLKNPVATAVLQSLKSLLAKRKLQAV